MRKHWLIALCVSSVFAAVCLLWPVHGSLPDEACSPEYLMFKDSPLLAAAYTRDFPLNDSLRLDVTTLVALDPAGWDTLTSRFGIADIRETFGEEIDGGKDIILSMRYSPDSAAAPGSNRGGFLAASPLRQTVCIFHTRTREQERAVLRYQMEKTMNSINKQH